MGPSGATESVGSPTRVKQPLLLSESGPDGDGGVAQESRTLQHGHGGRWTQTQPSPHLPVSTTYSWKRVQCVQCESRCWCSVRTEPRNVLCGRCSSTQMGVPEPAVPAGSREIQIGVLPLLFELRALLSALQTRIGAGVMAQEIDCSGDVSGWKA